MQTDDLTQELQSGEGALRSQKSLLFINMNFTEVQKAYHLRKMRTRVYRMDVNHDGYISREDFELMAKRLVENTCEINEKKREEIFQAFLSIPDTIGIKSGQKISLEETAKRATHHYLSLTAERPPEYHDKLFDCIDTNSDGMISMTEFKIYFKIIGHGITDEEMKHAFGTIDSNGDGKISREEFLAAAEDFYYGVEETELSHAFFGKLLPRLY